ncbi:hypothetical protein [Tateyamaria sp.]|uniref:hypothetical protein n=1 Tax=Tateyamaria sp. TaxID=1929288 RepID=UPI003B2197C3
MKREFLTSAPKAKRRVVTHFYYERSGKGETKDDHGCNRAAPKVCGTIRHKARMRVPRLGPNLGASFELSGSAQALVQKRDNRRTVP